MEYYLMMNQSPIEFWQYLYLIPIVLSIFLLMASLVFTNRHIGQRELLDLPKWLLIGSGLGLLLWFSFPYNIFILYTLLAFMSAFGAPITSVVIAAIITVGSWLMTSCAMSKMNKT
jgi:hypothetical protein